MFEFRSSIDADRNERQRTGLAGATSYSYRVRAIDAAGNLGAYSGTATSTTFVSSGTITFVQVKDGTPHSAQEQRWPSPTQRAVCRQSECRSSRLGRHGTVRAIGNGS